MRVPYLTSVVVALLLAVVLLSTTVGTTVATSTGTVTIKLDAATTQPAIFWGMNFVATHSPGSDAAAKLGATPTKLLVYPSGNATETVNMTNGAVYEIGHTGKASITIQTFISDCKAISCKAGIGLPMEINSPSTDAYEAKYIVDTLGFTPAYFSYGNEPEHYSCFDLSWASLAKGHQCNTGGTTATAFASETEAAIKAVTKVLGSKTPPSLCLNAGTGAGWSPDVAWMQALEANSYDKAACSAFAMHDKPAHSADGSPTLASFYATLTGPNGLPAVYLNMSKYTDGAPLYMTEVGPFTPTSVYLKPFANTWALNVLESALVVQAMQLKVPAMGWWAWNSEEGIYGYAKMPFYTIYSELFSQLGSSWMSTQYHGQNGLFGVATKGTSTWSLIMVSTSISTSYKISLTGSGFPTTGKGTLYLCTSSGLTTESVTLSSGFTLPAQSVALLATG
ncbi:MAG: hypothetical protein WA688_02075 [Thermoplasmata archaeon]